MRDMKRNGKMRRSKRKVCAFWISGTCAKHQRELTSSIKRSRNIALLPFTTE